jgi:hypothetical protein
MARMAQDDVCIKFIINRGSAKAGPCQFCIFQEQTLFPQKNAL